MNTKTKKKTESKKKSQSDKKKEKEIKTEIFNEIKDRYVKQSDPRYAAARLWIDEIINPLDTRKMIIESLDVVRNEGHIENASYGALQV